MLSNLNNNTNIVKTTKYKQWAASLLSMVSSFFTAPKPILFKNSVPSLHDSNQRPLLGTKFYSLYKLTFNPFCFYINKHFLSRILFEWFFVSGSWTGLRRNSLRVNAISRKWEPTKVFCFFFFFFLVNCFGWSYQSCSVIFVGTGYHVVTI